MNLKVDKMQRKAIVLAIVISITIPGLIIPTVHADHQFQEHVGYRGNFQVKEQWWIFYILKVDVQMWVSGDIWYSDTLMGWFLKEVYWYVPNIHIYDSNFQVTSISITNSKLMGGPYILEVSQIMEFKLSKGSLYRWITLELVMNTGDGHGDGEFTYTLGSGNLNLYWSKSVIRINDIYEPFAKYEQGYP